MYFKRPSFKRGGSTGIAQLTPSRQGYAGGGNIAPRVHANMGFPNFGVGQGDNTAYQKYLETMRANKASEQPIRETSGIEEILSGSDNRRSQFSETMTVEDLYKKKGEKLKRSADRFGSVDNTYIDKNNIKRSRQTGEVITDTASKSGIGQLTFTEADDIRQNYQFNQANEIVERAKDDKTTIELGAKDSSITLDPLKEIEREKNFLNNLLQNKGLERGEAALVAAKAIGTAGSFKDKLDAAVDMALPIVRKRNEQDKAVTLTAYKAFKEKEAAQAKAQVDAGKPTNELKNINLMAQAIKNQGDKRNLSVIRDELVVRQSGMDSDIKKIMLDATPNVLTLVKDINKQRKLLAIENSKKKPKEKNIEKIKENITGYEDDLKDLQSIGKDSFDSLFGDLTKGYFAEGGRVKRQLGSPEIGEQIVKTEDTVVSMPGGSVPEKPVLNLSYDELRNRLPKSITDDIIQLLANSEEALQEFAYITSQDDVNSFNVKYGVNLIIPPTTG
jgi:hypothetical protein